MKYTISIFLLFILGCNKSETKEGATMYSFDIVNNSEKEVLIVKQNEKNHIIKDIYLNEVREQDRICSILPTSNKEYVTTYPEVESIYLEANHVQTNRKGFRIIIRNTDVCPDIQYLDLSYKSSWIIESYGIINTCEDEKNEKYICAKQINKSIISLSGESLNVDTKKIKQLYFQGKSDCK